MAFQSQQQRSNKYRWNSISAEERSGGGGLNVWNLPGAFNTAEAGNERMKELMPAL